MELKIYSIKSWINVWKEKAAVYTTTALNNANLFINNLLTLTNTIFNTQKVAY